MNTNRLYLIRHGESWTNIVGRFSHKLVDDSLTLRGVAQAQATAICLKGKQIDEIYSSPLKRAVETAKVIAEHLSLKMVVLENFREINVGELERRQVSMEDWNLHDKIIEDWFSEKHETAFPDGENYLSLWDRMLKGIEQIIAHKSNRNIVVVGHAGIFAATLKDLCQEISVDQIRGSHIPNCSITEITISVQGERLRSTLVDWASVSHLSGL